MPPAIGATHLKLSSLVYRRELVVYLFIDYQTYQEDLPLPVLYQY